MWGSPGESGASACPGALSVRVGAGLRCLWDKGRIFVFFLRNIWREEEGKKTQNIEGDCPESGVWGIGELELLFPVR